MPYIAPQDRKKYEALAKEIQATQIATKGDLEYLTFLLLKRYSGTREINYTNLHDAVYAVRHASHEYERRFLDKREDSALEKNGDI